VYIFSVIASFHFADCLREFYEPVYGPFSQSCKGSWHKKSSWLIALQPYHSISHESVLVSFFSAAACIGPCRIVAAAV
jgi:hypothetical protein